MDLSPSTSGHQPKEPKGPKEPKEPNESHQPHQPHQAQRSSRAAHSDEVHPPEYDTMCGQMDFKQNGIDTNAKVAGIMSGEVLFFTVSFC